MLHSIPGGKNPHPCPKSIGKSEQPSDDDLTAAIGDVRRMASILATLLEDRIVDTGKGQSLTVGRRDAADIQFAARQVVDLADNVEQIWGTLP